jgi:hypothetical protein
MTRSRIRRGALLLCGGILATLSLSAVSADAQTVPSQPPPDMVRPDTPLPVLFLLYQAAQQARSPAAQPVTCPRHTKPRVDCTPVLQR